MLEQYADPATLLGASANDFVAGFVGADRGLKRLGVTPVDRADLERPPVVGATLRAALAAVLQTDSGWVAVADGERYVGVLTPGAVHAAARRSATGRPPAAPIKESWS